MCLRMMRRLDVHYKVANGTTHTHTHTHTHTQHAHTHIPTVLHSKGATCKVQPLRRDQQRQSQSMHGRQCICTCAVFSLDREASYWGAEPRAGVSCHPSQLATVSRHLILRHEPPFSLWLHKQMGAQPRWAFWPLSLPVNKQTTCLHLTRRNALFFRQLPHNSVMPDPHGRSRTGAPPPSYMDSRTVVLSARQTTHGPTRPPSCVYINRHVHKQDLA